MDFIQYHEAVFIFPQKQCGIGETLLIGPGFQIQIQSAGRFRYVERKSRFADLTRADQRDRRLAP